MTEDNEGPVTFNRYDEATGEWEEVSNDPSFDAEGFRAQIEEQAKNAAALRKESVLAAVEASQAAITGDAPAGEGDNLASLTSKGLKELASDRGVDITGLTKKSEVILALTAAAATFTVTGQEVGPDGSFEGTEAEAEELEAESAPDDEVEDTESETDPDEE